MNDRQQVTAYRTAEVTDVTWILAGPGGRLVHHARIGSDGIHLELGIDDSRTQPLDVPRGHLVPSLIRTLKICPVKGANGSVRPFPAARMAKLLGEDQAERDAALRKVGARTAWSITVDSWELAGINGPDGIHIASDDRLDPVTNTDFYRVLCVCFGDY